MGEKDPLKISGVFYCWSETEKGKEVNLSESLNKLILWRKWNEEKLEKNRENIVAAVWFQEKTDSISTLLLSLKSLEKWIQGIAEL